MLSSRTTTDETITNENMLYAGYLLSKNLIHIENHLAQRHKKPKKINKEYLTAYIEELNLVADKLRAMGVYYYQAIITTEDQLLHHHIKEQSQAFMELCNASNNLTNVIIADILHQKSHDHILLAAERWAYILKLSFERNDFYSCSAIVTALNNSSLSKVLIPDVLSKSAQAIITHIGSISVRPKILHMHHEMKFYACEQVVPALSALGNLLETVAVQPDDHDSKAHIEQEKTKFSLFYQRIQSTLHYDMSMIDKKLISTLNQLYEEDCHNAFIQRIQQISINTKNAINLNALTKAIGLYKNYDAFYVHSHELTCDIDSYHMENAKSQDPMVPLILKIMRDPKLSSNTKFKALTELEQAEADNIDAKQKEYINFFKRKLSMVMITVAHLPNPVPKIGAASTKAPDQSEEKSNDHVSRYASHHALLFAEKTSDSSDDTATIAPKKSYSLNIQLKKK